jgi:hypothetical protein
VILAANLACLGERFPELATLVEGAEEIRLEVCETASGDMSARLPGGLWLHSSREPRGEARRLAAAGLAPGADAAVLLGFGLGYAAEACLESGVDRVIACSASPGAIKAALGLRDLRTLLADERLGFVAGGESEGLIAALELSGASRAAIFENRAEASLEPEWFSRARRAAERWNAKGQVNENTLRRFGKLWVRNLARNLDQAAACPGVGRLEGLFEGEAVSDPMPAIVLAAGPGLDRVLPRIRDISRRALVVCVDTALRSLLRQGVEPDFLVVVDPQYWNWRHVAGLSSPSSILVSEMAAWPAVFRSSYRAAFLGGSLFPLGRRIESFSGSKGQLGAGGSVATSAWDLARLMGCSPLWMAGLDLSFPEGQTHARASLFEQRALGSGSRLLPASSAQAAALVGGASFEARAADGGKVRTDQRMTLYAWWFESRLCRPLSPRTISLSPGGLAIPGLELARADELLSLPDRRREIEAGLARAAIMGPSAESPSEARAAAAKGLDELLRQLQSIASIAEAARAASREGQAAFARGGDCSASVSALEAADRALLGLDAREIAGFLLPPLSELTGRRARDLGESLAQSESLYQSLEESARYHLEMLRQARTRA